jgi:t-SNARE complex subunit (syntaxin)
VLDGTLEDLERFIDAGGAKRQAQAMLDAERDGKARVGAMERLEQVIAS